MKYSLIDYCYFSECQTFLTVLMIYFILKSWQMKLCTNLTDQVKVFLIYYHKLVTNSIYQLLFQTISCCKFAPIN